MKLFNVLGTLLCMAFHAARLGGSELLSGTEKRPGGEYSRVDLRLTQQYSRKQIVSENLPPDVSITFPPNDVLFDGESCAVRVRAIDIDGTVSMVQLFSGSDFVRTNLVGTITNEPFVFNWTPSPDSFSILFEVLTAVAIDNKGLTNMSAPVRVSLPHFLPNTPSFLITSPTNQTILAAPAAFEFSAKLTATDGSGNAAVFFIGTNQIGLAPDPPYSIGVSNLFEGDHILSIGSTNRAGVMKFSVPRQIKVVSALLSGPQKKDDNRFEFKAAGRFAERPVVIERSEDFLLWYPAVTNILSTNSFLFEEPIVLNHPFRFYRLRLPP